MRTSCILLVLLGLSGIAHAQTMVELTWFDRDMASCLPGTPLPANCSARARLLVEVAPIDWAVGPVRFYLRSEMFARRAREEAGHATPVSADLGAGAGVRWGRWSARVLMSSRHCFDTVCVGQAYNGLILRWRAEP